MEIIDTQIHFGPGGIEEVVAAMDAIGIGAAVIAESWRVTAGQPSSPSYEVGPGVYRPTAPTAELAAWTHPGRFCHLLKIDHRDPEIASLARLARDNPHCRALRTIPGGGGDRDLIRAFGAGDYDPVFAAACDNGLPLFVLIDGNTEMLNPYLDRFPDLRVIIDHTGMPLGRLMRRIVAGVDKAADAQAYWDRIGAEPLDAAFDRVLRIAGRPNVALKWAHAQEMFDSPGFPNAGTWPWLRKAIDAFGADRIMFASDHSVNLGGESWAELVFAIRANPDLTDEERRWIFSGTARKWLDWPA